MEEQTEYKKLYKELSIKWYYVEELSDRLIKDTIHLLKLYEKRIEPQEERKNAKYIRSCLYAYNEYGFCYMDLTRLIKIIQYFFRFNCSFNSIFKIPNVKTNLEEHLKNEHARNLKNEILQIKEFNKETKQEIKALEHRMLGVNSVQTDKVHIENATHNDSKLLDLMEQVDYLKRDIDYKNELIAHLQDIVNAQAST